MKGLTMKQDDIFRAAEAADPWLRIQEAELNERVESVKPKVEAAKLHIPIVKRAQADGAKVLQWFGSYNWDVIAITPDCILEVGELSRLVGESLDPVTEAIQEFEGLTVADVADSCGRWPIDPNRIGSTMAHIETCLLSVKGKETRIYDLVATIKRGTDEARDILESRGVPSDRATIAIPKHPGEVNIVERVLNARR